MFNREVSKEDKALRIPIKVLDEKWKILLLSIVNNVSLSIPIALEGQFSLLIYGG